MITSAVIVRFGLMIVMIFDLTASSTSLHVLRYFSLRGIYYIFMLRHFIWKKQWLRLETVVEVADEWRMDDIKGLFGRCNFKADMLDRKVSLIPS